MHFSVLRSCKRICPGPRLYVTAYSIYSQLPSTFEEDLLYEEPEDAPW
jgi:hypothetical protein